MHANLTEGNSKEEMQMFLYEASNTEEPCAGKPYAQGKFILTSKPLFYRYRTNRKFCT